MCRNIKRNGILWYDCISDIIQFISKKLDSCQGFLRLRKHTFQMQKDFDFQWFSDDQRNREEGSLTTDFWKIELHKNPAMIWNFRSFSNDRRKLFFVFPEQGYFTYFGKFEPQSNWKSTSSLWHESNLSTYYQHILF